MATNDETMKQDWWCLSMDGLYHQLNILWYNMNDIFGREKVFREVAQEHYATMKSSQKENDLFSYYGKSTHSNIWTISTLYKNIQNDQYKHPNISSINHTHNIMETHVDNCYGQTLGSPTIHKYRYIMFYFDQFLTKKIKKLCVLLVNENSLCAIIYFRT